MTNEEIQRKLDELEQKRTIIKKVHELHVLETDLVVSTIRNGVEHMEQLSARLRSSRPRSA